MLNSICLNCGSDVHSRFCAECGQKAATSRITLPHFVQHDLLHGFWHLDKGIIFTLRAALIRPGQAALDYIRGKRIRYYNVFYLSLLLIGFHLLLKHTYTLFPQFAPPAEESEAMTYLREHIKVAFLFTVPLLSLNAWVVFHRLKLNIAEHFIVGGFTLVGMLVFIILMGLMDALSAIWSSNPVTGWLEVLFFIVIMCFPIWSYGNLCRGRYRFLGLAWRLIAFEILILSELLIILMMIFYYITGDTALLIDM